jgi:hypothetical protein
MTKIFVVFKKQEGELVNAYSLVDAETLLTIPSDLIQAKKEVEDKLYTSEEFEAMVAELTN